MDRATPSISFDDGAELLDCDSCLDVLLGGHYHSEPAHKAASGRGITRIGLRPHKSSSRDWSKLVSSAGAGCRSGHRGTVASEHLVSMRCSIYAHLRVGSSRSLA